MLQAWLSDNPTTI